MGMIDGFAKEHLPQSKALFDYISKLDFESGDYFCFKSGGDGDNGEVLMDYFDHFFAKNCQPAADVVPVVHGKWITKLIGERPYCSACYKTHDCFEWTPRYCPNCGAKMGGVSE